MFKTAQLFSVHLLLSKDHSFNQILKLKSNFSDRKSPPISTLSDWSQDSAASSYRSRPKSNNEGKQNIVIKTFLTVSDAVQEIAL